MFSGAFPESRYSPGEISSYTIIEVYLCSNLKGRAKTDTKTDFNTLHKRMRNLKSALRVINTKVVVECMISGMDGLKIDCI